MLIQNFWMLILIRKIIVFLYKKINQHKNIIISEVINDTNLDEKEKDNIIKTIEKINKEEIKELNKKDKWTSEEVDILLNKISLKYKPEIDKEQSENILKEFKRNVKLHDENLINEDNNFDDFKTDDQLFECKNCDSKYGSLHSNIEGLEGSSPICNNCNQCIIKCCVC